MKYDITVRLNIVDNPEFGEKEFYLRTTVTDQGTGLDSEVVKLMNQNEDTLNINNLKTGFNLNISTSKILASAQKGSVSIKSEKDLGNQVSLLIKVVQQISENNSTTRLYTPLRKSFALQSVSGSIMSSEK